MSKHEYFKACNEFVILTNEFEHLYYDKGIRTGKRIESLERKINKLSKVIEDYERMKTIDSYTMNIIPA